MVENVLLLLEGHRHWILLYSSDNRPTIDRFESAHLMRISMKPTVGRR